MITIYLDKQVFSHLFNAREEKYSLLRDKILSHKDEFIFFYSNAHLFDLQDDKTDIKYVEMEFMQSIVDVNQYCPKYFVKKQKGITVLSVEHILKTLYRKEFWYCLPGRFSSHLTSPETSSRFTVATLCAAFQAV